MSELTPCNYCSLNSIKRRADRNGKRVTTQWRNGWLEVYVHPSDVKIVNDKDREKYRQGSMMALTDHCVC